MARQLSWIAVALATVLGACSASSSRGDSGAPAAPAATSSELVVISTPAAGSTVAGPVNRLVLRFSAPVALGEVTVSGPDGVMPMMLSSAGVLTDFEIPLPGLGSGHYKVAWKANQGGVQRAGEFEFTVR